MNEQKLKVAAILKIKHAGLRRAAKEAGSQSELARILGLGPTTIGLWCNLQACPPDSPRGKWTAERLEKLAGDLLVLTGESMDQLFPPELRDKCKRDSSPIYFEREIELRDLLLEDRRNREGERFYLPDPADVLEQSLLKDSLKKSMEPLSHREREILKLRFGLEGEYTYTQAEVAHIFQVSIERIRQIEKSAISKIRSAARFGSGSLPQFLDGPEADEDIKNRKEKKELQVIIARQRQRQKKEIDLEKTKA